MHLASMFSCFPPYILCCSYKIFVPVVFMQLLCLKKSVFDAFALCFADYGDDW